MWDHLGWLYSLTSILASALHWWGPEGRNSTVCSYLYIYIYIYIYIHISSRSNSVFRHQEQWCPDFHILSKVTSDSSSQRLTKLRRMGYFAFFQLLSDNRRPWNTCHRSRHTDWFSELRNATQRITKRTLCFLRFHSISVSI